MTTITQSSAKSAEEFSYFIPTFRMILLEQDYSAILRALKKRFFIPLCSIQNNKKHTLICDHLRNLWLKKDSF